MAVPTPPTRSTLIAEGFKKANQLNPSAALLSRADTEWMNEIVNEVMVAATKYGGKLASLLATEYVMTVAGKSSYDYPSEYLSDLSVTLLDGDERGTLQTATANSLTLASDAELTATTAQGKLAVIISGTGAGEAGQIYSYDATTKIALTTPSFTVTPVVGDGYVVVDKNYDLAPMAIRNKDMLYNEFVVQRPYQYSSLANNTSGRFEVFPVPDKVYPMRLRFYADLGKLDATGTLANTLYQNWRNLFVLGIAYKAYLDKSDTRAVKIQRDYEGMILMLLDREAGGREQDSMSFQPDRR